MKENWIVKIKDLDFLNKDFGYIRDYARENYGLYMVVRNHNMEGYFYRIVDNSENKLEILYDSKGKRYGFLEAKNKCIEKLIEILEEYNLPGS